MKTQSAGFTLIEMMVTIVVLALLLAVGIPSFRDFMRNSRMVSAANDVVTDFNLARSESVKRRVPVTLCKSQDGAACDADASAPFRSWIVFVNLDRDSPAVREDGEPLLRAYGRWDAGRINANRATLSFRPFGQSGVTATFTFCDPRGPVAARAVIISQTGRPRVSDRSASNGPLTCV